MGNSHSPLGLLWRSIYKNTFDIDNDIDNIQATIVIAVLVSNLVFLVFVSFVLLASFVAGK